MNASTGTTARRLLLTALLYAVPLIMVIGPVLDPDIWWHLRTARWIVEHRAVPWTDPFTPATIPGPWIAYWWLFEIGVYGLYSLLGLAGIVVYKLVLAVVIIAALHALIRSFEIAFWAEGALLGIATAAMMPVLAQPRSWLVSVLFFTVTLVVVVRVRRGADRRALWLLIPMFALWANIHIQFVYGFFVLIVAGVEAIVERRRDDVRAYSSALLGCLLATAIGPYHVLIYRAVWDAIRLTQAFLYLQELQALAFRSPSDWLALALVVAAAFALGRQRRVRLLPAALLAAGAFASFRAMRDVWFVAIVSAAVLAESLPVGEAALRFRVTRRHASMIAACLLVVVGAVAAWRLTPSRLEAQVAKVYPEAAAEVVAARGYPGPLFNHYDWGGFLIWRLPELAVSMDGRNTIYDQRRLMQSMDTWNGKAGWASDPDLLRAGVVVASARQPLGSLLRLDHRFRLVYEDDVALVFIPREHRVARN